MKQPMNMDGTNNCRANRYRRDNMLRKLLDRVRDKKSGYWKDRIKAQLKYAEKLSKVMEEG